MKLLGIDDESTYKQIEYELLHKFEILRPGFTRLNLHYTMSKFELDYIIDALIFVVKHGHKFLPLYAYFVDTGEFRHRKHIKTFPDRRSLGFIKINENGFHYTNKHRELKNDNECKVAMNKYLEYANNFLHNIDKQYPKHLSDVHFTENQQRYRWFILPSEVLSNIQTNISIDNFLKTNIIKEDAPSNNPNHIKTVKNNDTEDDIFDRFLITFGFTIIVIYGQKYTESQFSFNQSFIFIFLCCLLMVSFQVNNPKQQIIYTTQTTNKMDENKSILYPNMNNESKLDNDIIIEKTKHKCINCFHYHHQNIKECPDCSCINYLYNINKKEMKKLHKKLSHDIGKAIKDYNMIKDGDKVLIALSGGKDSLTMLHILLSLQKKAPINFKIGCCTIDPNHPEYNPKPLIKYLNDLNIPYYYEKQNILDNALKYMDKNKISFCSFCSRMKRGALYSVCKREGYNVLAMGQHLDDLCESFIMSSFFNGRLRTMKCNYFDNTGNIRIIRPLIYVREKLCKKYSILYQLPVINENCPACYDEPKQRQNVKMILAKQEQLNPKIFCNLLKTIKPLMEMDNIAKWKNNDNISFNDKIKQQIKQTIQQ